MRRILRMRLHLNPFLWKNTEHIRQMGRDSYNIRMTTSLKIFSRLGLFDRSSLLPKVALIHKMGSQTANNLHDTDKRRSMIHFEISSYSMPYSHVVYVRNTYFYNAIVRHWDTTCRSNRGVTGLRDYVYLLSSLAYFSIRIPVHCLRSYK
jgi:hypothetical protein